MQRSFAEYDGFRKQRKITRREVFLAEMDRVVPWDRLQALIEPRYPVAGNGPAALCRRSLDCLTSRSRRAVRL